MVHVVGQLIHQLHRARLMACADFPAHSDAFALHSGDSEVKDGLAELVTCLFLDHLRIVSKSAGGNDDRVGSCLDLLSVLILCKDADCLTVFHKNFGDRCLELEVHAEFTSALGHLLGHSRRSSRAWDSAALRLADVPGELTVRVGTSCLRGRKCTLHADKFDTHVHEPVNDLTGLEVIIADHACIHAVMREIHVLAESFAGGQRDHMLSLNTGADTQGTHAHVGSTAGGVGLLEAEYGRAVFRGGDAGSQTGQAGSNYNDISLHLLHK